MIAVSPCKSAEDERLGLDVYNAVWPHERIGLVEDRWYKACAVEHVDLIARVDGEVAGSAVGLLQAERPRLVLTFLTVHPQRRGLGAGTALHEGVTDWARARGLETIEAVVADNDPDSLAFAERRGFAEDRREKGVALDLRRADPPRVDPPEGIEIVTWAERPELGPGMYEVAVEAYPDVPGWENEQLEPYEDWLAHDMQGPGDRPEATFVALAGDEVVGYAKFSLTPVHATTAHHDLTGVKRAWRGRGVARALKARQIAWAKENGYEELRTRNDERNAPIRRLNDEFGYRPTVGRIYVQARVSDGL